VRGGRLLDDGADALLGELIELVERTEARVVGGNGKRVIPRAVCIGEEVIAGLHTVVPRAQVQAKIPDDGLDGSERGGCGRRRGTGGCDGHRFLLDGFEAQAARTSAASHDSNLIDLGTFDAAQKARIHTAVRRRREAGGAKCRRTRGRVARFVGAGTRLVALYSPQ